MQVGQKVRQVAGYLGRFSMRWMGLDIAAKVAATAALYLWAAQTDENLLTLQQCGTAYYHHQVHTPTSNFACTHRPGRLDRVIEVGLPSAQDCRKILAAATSSMALGPAVKLDKIAEWPQLATASGASLVAFCREAAFSSLREHRAKEESEKSSSLDQVHESSSDAPIIVDMRHFELAVSRLC